MRLERSAVPLLLILAGCPGSDPLEITTSELPPGTVGQEYAFQLTAEGGDGSYSWRIDGELPVGIALSAGGLLSGAPTMAGAFTFTLRVVDRAGAEARRTLTLTVESATPAELAIATGALPAAVVGEPYDQAIAAQGGSGPYAWAVSEGSPPPGLQLGASGTPATALSGTPTAEGSYTFTVTVTDRSSQSASTSFTLVVQPETFAIRTLALPDGVVGEPYSAPLQIAAATGTVTWSIAGGALPPGLALVEEGHPHGELAGTPSQEGSFSFVVRAEDEDGDLATQEYTVQVAAAPVAIQTAALPDAILGVVYRAEIMASGGSGAGFTWSVTGGELPPGLTLATAGAPATEISGTATATGTWTATITVRDTAGDSDARSFELTVTDLMPLEITTATLPDRTECAAQRDAITASGGSQEGYVWTVIGGLPLGLSVDVEGTPATVLSGRATAPGTYGLELEVRDSAGFAAQRTLSVTVGADPTAQRHAILVGDLATAGDREVFLIDACGDRASGLTALNPPAPGTGDASPDPGSAAFSPDGRRIAFIGDFMIDGVDELFLGTTANPGMRRRINGPLAAGGNVRALSWSPDSTLVVYFADQNADGIDEIFVVDVSNPAAPSFPVRVNAPLTSMTSAVTHVSWAPDSEGLVYRADEADGVFELFWVDLSIPTLPGAAVRLHAPLTAPRSCDPEIEWSPSGNALAYRCDAATAGVFELWYVRFSIRVPGAAQRANGTLVANGDVMPASFAFSPDGSGLAYLADQTVDQTDELYLAVTFGGTVMPGVRVMSALPANRDVTAFRFAPSGLRGLIRGDLDTDEAFELYLLDAAAGFPALPVRVSGGVNVDPLRFGFSGDGGFAAYLADRLYAVDLRGASPGAPLGLSTAPIEVFAFAPSGTRIAMRGDASLAFAELPSGGVQVLSTTPETGDFVWRADSGGLLFSAGAAGWSVDLSAPTAAAPVPLHPALPMNGRLDYLRLQP